MKLWRIWKKRWTDSCADYGGEGMFKKVLTVVLALLCLQSAMCVAADLTNEQLYNKARKHMERPESTDIRLLVTFVDSDKNVTWNKTRDKVLLVSFTKDLDEFPVGRKNVFMRNIWCFSEKELENWYKDNKDKMGRDRRMRIRQLTGLNPQATEDSFAVFWANPKDVLRPANQSNPFVDGMEVHSQAYKDVNQSESKVQGFDLKRISLEKKQEKNSGRVATHLGYTFDWSTPGRQYGLTEFMVPPFNQGWIIGTYSFDEYFKYLDEKLGGR